MADYLNFYEIGAHYTTFRAGASIVYDQLQKNGSVHVGKAVMMSGAETVDLVTTGSEIIGKLIKVEPDGMCSVQDEGYCEVPSDGTTITYTQANNGLVGGATAGLVKTATLVPAVGAVRNARSVKPAVGNSLILRLG